MRTAKLTAKPNENHEQPQTPANNTIPQRGTTGRPTKTQGEARGECYNNLLDHSGKATQHNGKHYFRPHGNP